MSILASLNGGGGGGGLGEAVETATYNASDEVSGHTIEGLESGIYRLVFKCDNWGLSGVGGTASSRMAFNFGGIDAGLDTAENGYDAQMGYVSGTALGDAQTNALDYFSPIHTNGSGGEVVDVLIYLDTAGDCWVQGQCIKRATSGATGTTTLASYFFGGVYRGTAHDKTKIGVSYFGGFLGGTSRDFGDNTTINLWKIGELA